MMEYILKYNDERYFYNEAHGIVVNRMEKGSSPKIVFSDSKEPFSIAEMKSRVHIVCVSKDNVLTYIIKKGSRYYDYKLLKIKDNCRVMNIELVTVGSLIHLLYSAMYEDDIILVHCVLGNNAKPIVIDKLRNKDFFVAERKVYYTNKSNVLGFQDLSDGKPDRFEKIIENADNPFLYKDEDKEYLIYKKSNSIYINHECKIKDEEADNIIVTAKGEKNILMWQSGPIVRYIDIDKIGMESPKRKMSTAMLVLCKILDNGRIAYDFFALTRD